VHFLWPFAAIVLAFGSCLLTWGLNQSRRNSSSYAIHPDAIFLAGSNWKSRILAILFILAVFSSLIGLARPQMPFWAPDPQARVVLALDVSRSMRADDIKPTRIEAATRAAKKFVSSLPAGVHIGLVTFSAGAVLNVPVGTDRARVLEALESPELGHGTAIGAGLLEAVQALAQGSSSATVVLLSDGSNTTGPTPPEAAEKAKLARVTVHTIGVGSLGLRYNPTGSAAGALYWMGFDEAALKLIASTTGGQYHFVDSKQAFERAYSRLSGSLGWAWMRIEVTALAAMFTSLLLISSLIGSGFYRHLT
jgi:Ca-activated chloride channel homolog